MNYKYVFETFDNVCNICGIEAYYPELYRFKRRIPPPLRRRDECE